MQYDFILSTEKSKKCRNGTGTIKQLSERQGYMHENEDELFMCI